MESEEINFSWSPEDLVAFREYFDSHTPDGDKQPKTRALVWVFIAFMAGFFAPLFFWKRLPETYLELAMLLASPLTAVAAVVLLLRLKPLRYLWLLLAMPQARAKLQHPENAIQQIRIQIGPDSITVSGRGSSEKIQALWTHTYRWDYIQRIVVEGTYGYFIIGPYRGYIVPESAFRDEGSFRAFVDQATEYHKAATKPNDGIPVLA